MFRKKLTAFLRRMGLYNLWLLPLLLCTFLITGCDQSLSGISASDIAAVVDAVQEISADIAEITETAAVVEAKKNQTAAPDPKKTGTASETKVSEAPSGTKKTTEAAVETKAQHITVTEDGVYDTADEVGLYVHLYGHLPSNFMTKSEARRKGWENGALSRIIPGKSIGGSVFTNAEGRLPSKKGRTYYECDLETTGKKKRGTKRLVYSDDGLIYVTEDHYETFTLLYGDP